MTPDCLDPAALRWSGHGRAAVLHLDRAGTALHLPAEPASLPVLEVLARSALREFPLLDPRTPCAEWIHGFTDQLLGAMSAVRTGGLPDTPHWPHRAHLLHENATAP
ncbi:hypothetical protein [Nocardiopsis baichengensis]|uniref:hypothetical protein n=1 Tax=Nocardiopsis baichengensis TaxID=280240 RepID=UPI000346F41A|nr:hypothetical protein [Nocardiopsis baichengensis]